MGKLLSSSSSFLPWLSLVAIIWIQSISGTSFDFSAYSSQLKSRLAISQVKLNYLTVASDAGKLFGWCSGVAALYLSLPSVLLIGGAVGAVGYGVQYLFLAGKIHSLSYWQTLILQLLAGNSICWINTASYVASMRKFHVDRGAVVGISTSYSALSAKIYIAVYQVVLGAHGSDSLYLLLNAVTPLAVGVVMSPFIMDRVPSGEVSRSCLVAMFGIACVTGVYSVVATVVPEMERVSERTPKVVLLVMVVAVVLVPMVKAVEWLRESKCKAIRVAEGDGGGVVVTPEVEEEEEMEEVKEYSVRDLMLSVDFWLYFWVYLCGGTLGLVYMNNLGQISESRGVGDTVLLSISSSFGFFGKLGTAPLMAFTRKRYMVSTPALMMMLMAPMSASFFLLLDPTTVSLFASTAIIGMCSGAMTSIAVSITAELFGSKHFGVNHNVVIANIPIGSFLFGFIAGYIYDREGEREGAANMGTTCMGARCFHKTFMLWGMICFVGTILSVVLYLRTRRTCRKSQSVV